MSVEQFITCKTEDDVAVVTLNRPKALNALNLTVLQQLKEVLENCEINGIKVIILTGAGDKAFAAGADIAAMSMMNPQEAQAFSSTGQEVMNYIGQMKAIVIAAVNGYALGGGCELAMACDFRIASDNAQFGIPEVTLGVIPGFGGTQRLSRLIGLGRAVELMATGATIKASDAFHFGLVNEVTSQDDLLETCLAKAGKIVKNSSVAIALGKRSILEGAEMDLQRGLILETNLFALSFAGPDQKEGMKAFLEKRTPEYH